MCRAYRGQLRPKLVHSEAAPPPWRSPPHIAFILHWLTEAALFLDFCVFRGTGRKTDSHPPLSVFVFRFHQTDKWSGQSGDRGLFWNDKHLNNSLRDRSAGGGIFVWPLYPWHQHCGYCYPTSIFPSFFYLWFVIMKTTSKDHKDVGLSNVCTFTKQHFHSDL